LLIVLQRMPVPLLGKPPLGKQASIAAPLAETEVDASSSASSSAAAPHHHRARRVVSAAAEIGPELRHLWKVYFYFKESVLKKRSVEIFLHRSSYSLQPIQEMSHEKLASYLDQVSNRILQMLQVPRIAPLETVPASASTPASMPPCVLYMFSLPVFLTSEKSSQPSSPKKPRSISRNTSAMFSSTGSSASLLRALTNNIDEQSSLPMQMARFVQDNIDIVLLSSLLQERGFIGDMRSFALNSLADQLCRENLSLVDEHVRIKFCVCLFV